MLSLLRSNLRRSLGVSSGNLCLTRDRHPKALCTRKLSFRYLNGSSQNHTGDKFHASPQKMAEDGDDDLLGELGDLQELGEVMDMEEFEALFGDAAARELLIDNDKYDAQQDEEPEVLNGGDDHENHESLDDDWLEDDEDDEMLRGMEKKVKQKVQVRRAKHSKQRFVDRIRVKATGGHGGNGCASFFCNTAFRKRPNGGHGGAGGNVYLVADDKIQNLSTATHHFRGGSGTNGTSNDCAGKRGKNVVFKVPCGTLVKRVYREERETEDGEYEIVDHMDPVMDLDHHGASFLAATGGKPGLGNRILAGKTTSYGRLRKQMPEGKTLGSPGASAYYELELKTIADVGLVGYPNAGKSTLLSTLSRATPAIAPYPFTTLHPYVGIVEFPDTYRLSIADIPGLIEGAHRNVGLGHEFLRHIERTQILMYVLDTAGTEGRDPLSDFHHLQRELELYAQNITTRPSLIVANKMDEPGAEQNLHRIRKATDMTVVPVSALHKVDVDVVAKSLRWMMEKISKST